MESKMSSINCNRSTYYKPCINIRNYLRRLGYQQKLPIRSPLNFEIWYFLVINRFFVKEKSKYYSFKILIFSDFFIQCSLWEKCSLKTSLLKMLNHFIVYIITFNREVFRVYIEFSIFLTTDCPMIVLRPVCPRNVLRENSWIYFQVADIVSATMKNTKNCFRNFIINHCEIY